MSIYTQSIYRTGYTPDRRYCIAAIGVRDAKSIADLCNNAGSGGFVVGLRVISSLRTLLCQHGLDHINHNALARIASSAQTVPDFT